VCQPPVRRGTGRRSDQGGAQAVAHDSRGGRGRVPPKSHQHDYQQDTQLQVSETVGEPSDPLAGRLHNFQHGKCTWGLYIILLLYIPSMASILYIILSDGYFNSEHLPDI